MHLMELTLAGGLIVQVIVEGHDVGIDSLCDVADVVE